MPSWYGGPDGIKEPTTSIGGFLARFEASREHERVRRELLPPVWINADVDDARGPLGELFEDVLGRAREHVGCSERRSAGSPSERACPAGCRSGGRGAARSVAGVAVLADLAEEVALARREVVRLRLRLADVVEVVDPAAGFAAARIDARPGFAIGVGGRPGRRRVLYGEPERSASFVSDSVPGMSRP